MARLSAYQGKLALVTGADDGIGEMLAKGFGNAGMRVCVQDIRRQAAERGATEIGSLAFALAFDVSDREAAVAAAESVGEPINLLWLNAGVGVGAPVIGGRPRVIDWAFAVNALGVIWTAQAFRALLAAADGVRHVGITASAAALAPPTGDFPLYATTKHATLAIGEALRGELASDDIGVTILCPGLLNTNIWDAARARPERLGGVSRRDPATAGPWQQAKAPSVMWPHIAKTIESGGGYLVCATQGDTTRLAFQARAQAILESIVEV